MERARRGLQSADQWRGGQSDHWGSATPVLSLGRNDRSDRHWGKGGAMEVGATENTGRLEEYFFYVNI